MKNVINTFIKNCSKIEKVMLICATIIAITMALFFCHGDAYEGIIPWGLDFIRTIKSGKVLNYYSEINGIGMYNILVILISAIWQAPLFTICKLIDADSLILYIVWWKILLIIIYLICAIMVIDILFLLQYEHKKIFCGVLSFMVSPFVLWGNIAMGQVDLIAFLFVLVAIRFFCAEQYHKMCFAFSIAISFKFIPILIAIPILFIVEKRTLKLVKYGAELLVFPMIVELCSRFINGYLQTKNSFMMSRVFEYNFNFMNVFLFLMTIAMIGCYYRYQELNSRRNDLIFALIPYTIFVFSVTVHPQWVIYSCILIIIAQLEIVDRLLAVILNVGMGIGYILYVTSLYEYSVDNYMMNHGMASYILGKEYNYKTIWQTVLIDMNAGKAVFLGCLVMSIVIAFLDNKCKKRRTGNVNTWMTNILYFVPSVMVLASSLILYLINI